MPMKSKALTCACAVLFAASVLLLALPQRAAGQDNTNNNDDPPGRVARLSFLQGAVSFQPAGESDWVLATINRPVTTGDKLWVDSGSRAELHIGSAAIRLGGNTGFSFLNLDDRTVQIQLSAGTLYLRVSRFERDDNFEVDTPNQAFSIMRSGRYRFDASEDGNSTVVAVRQGQGEASGADRTYTVESGQRALLTGTDSLSADIDKIAGRDRDDFDEWCETRDQRDDHSRSTKYVSADLVGYEDLDDNGVWRHDSEYGEIWVPTAIPAGWAPYRYGHWAWISPWGWTWVDDAAWGYAPFHYGRWVYARDAWGWVPGPIGVAPVYAPALVAFVGTPHFTVTVGVGELAAVGWFPLGPREVYVPSYQGSREYVNRVNVSNTTVSSTTVTNVYNTTVINNVNSKQVTRVNYVNRTAPGAVTAVPVGTFRGAQPVARAAVPVDQRQMAAAPVIMRADVAPTSKSVFGASESRARMAAPPRAIVERPVFAKMAPPPPPVSFQQQESALAAHPGRPLAHSEVETLRPANVESAHPMVRQAPGREQQTDRNRPEPNRPGGDRSVGEPGVSSGRPDNQPANGPSGTLAGRQANAPSAEAPSQNMPRNVPPRNDRPLSAQPEYRGRPGNQPDAQPSLQPAKGQPAYVQPGNQPIGGGQPSQPVNPQAAPSNVPPQRTDRPASAQPEFRGRPFNQPDAQPSSQPSRGQPSVQPSVQPNNVSGRQPNTPPPAPPNNRLPNSQPNYQPPPASNRPNPVPQPASNPQPPSAPRNRSLSVPAPEPRRNVAPNPPPPPPPAATPRPAPPAPPSPPPAAAAPPAHNEGPAKGGNAPHGNGNKDDRKDDKKKN